MAELFYRAGGAMYAIALREAEGDLTAEPAVELFRGVYEQRPGFRANYEILPDGRFLMLRRGGPPHAADHRLVELEDDAELN